MDDTLAQKVAGYWGFLVKIGLIVEGTDFAEEVTVRFDLASAL